MITAITIPINNLFLHTGYTGDPDSDEGCYDHTVGPDRVTISPRDGCLVKNETYSVGQKWNDGCDYTCTCSLKLAILCQVRFIIVTNRGHPENASEDLRGGQGVSNFDVVRY